MVLGTSYAFVVTAFSSVLGAARKVIYVRIQRNNFFIARRGAKSINEIELFMGRIIGGHLIALLAFPNLLPPLSHLRRPERRPSVRTADHPAAKIITHLVCVLLQFQSRMQLPTIFIPSCYKSSLLACLARACNRIIDSRPEINSLVACRRQNKNVCGCGWYLALSMFARNQFSD